MAANLLLNQVSNEFGGDALNRIASIIGESPGKIKTALSDMLPVILGGLASKAQTKEGAHELLDVIHRDHLDNARYEHVADAISDPDAMGNLMSTGRPLLDTVLSGKSGAVSDWVATHSGINPSSSKSLMSLALPLVLGLIGRRVGSGGESGLMSLLGKPFSFLQDAPSGLASILGMGGATSAARSTVTEIEQRGQRYATEMADAAPSRKWLLPLFVVLGLIALAGYFMSRPVLTSAPVTEPVAAVPALGEFMSQTLPNGTVLRVPVNGIEDKLIAFIEDTGSQVSPTLWFNFDRLEFATNTAILTPSSQEQLSNIAEIMKVYPQVEVKIGGYTDNIGDAETNLQLSRERATSTMNQLTSMGVDPSRIAAEGYGDQSPVDDNATAEGRQHNRRVALNVTKK